MRFILAVVAVVWMMVVRLASVACRECLGCSACGDGAAPFVRLTIKNKINTQRRKRVARFSPRTYDPKKLINWETTYHPRVRCTVCFDATQG